MKQVFPLVIILILFGCKSIPKEKLRHVKTEVSYEINSDTLSIDLSNPLKCPLRITLSSGIAAVQEIIEPSFPILLPPTSDTILQFILDTKITNAKLRLGWFYGDPDAQIHPSPIAFPFPKGKSYKIIQAYNGSYSHSNPFSRYAVDFSLKKKDTICAVADGYVVGITKGYKYGGDSRKWRGYANYITLFHPQMNIFTQYVHLFQDGVLVELGDSVTTGTPIGLAGMTGFTDVQHLHFNVLKSYSKGLKSVPIDFQKGIRGTDLKKGMMVKSEK